MLDFKKWIEKAQIPQKKNERLWCILSDIQIFSINFLDWYETQKLQKLGPSTKNAGPYNARISKPI